MIHKSGKGERLRQPAPPEIVEMLRADIEQGVVLGFGNPRVETLLTGAGTEITILTMVSEDKVVFSTQVLGKRRLQAFSSFFEGNLDLTTSRHFEAVSPHLVRRVVDGALDALLRSHRADMATMTAIGIPVMASSFDFHAVSNAFHQIHATAMASNLHLTMRSIMMPAWSLTKPIAERNIAFELASPMERLRMARS